MDWKQLRNEDIKYGMSESEYQFLYALVGLIKPKTILEIGTANGFSAMVMAQASRDYEFPMKITSIDLSPELHAEAKELIKARGYDDIITCVFGDSRTESHNYPSEFVLLDGDHKFEEQIKDYHQIRDFPDLKTIVVHDTNSPRVDLSWSSIFTVEEIRKDPRWQVLNFQNYGASGFWKNGKCWITGIQGIAVIRKIEAIE